MKRNRLCAGKQTAPSAPRIGKRQRSAWRWAWFLSLLGLALVSCNIGRSLAVPGSASPPEPLFSPDPRFGVIESYESPPDAAVLGPGWTRVRFHWATTQATGPDSWTPEVSEAQIEAEVAAGRLVVGLLIGIPEWARGQDRLPAGLWLDPQDPQNVWARYVEQVVTRYQGRIDHWVIWNEPDIWDAAAPGHTWDGSEADFAQLQRVAYVTAKEHNPQAIIHLPAMTYFWDAQFGREQYLGRLLDEIMADPQAAQHNYYFDVATAHLYFQPNLIYDILLEFQMMMRQRGMDKPIWLVETNAPPVDDPIWPVESVTLSVLQVEQAAFMPQALAAALAAGAERIAVYKLQDTAGDLLANPEPFGLVRRDGTRRPAFDTYMVATRYLAEAWAATRETWHEVGQIRLDQPGRSTTVVFARLPIPQQAQVTATAETALLVDMWGQSETVFPIDGYYQIDLPPALCSQSIGDYCMIGGETFYLIQAADRLPPPTATPPATPTNLPTSPPAAAAATSLPATLTAGAATSLPGSATPLAMITMTQSSSPSTITTLLVPTVVVSEQALTVSPIPTMPPATLPAADTPADTELTTLAMIGRIMGTMLLFALPILSWHLFRQYRQR